jgi:hypothetical protein
MAKRRKKEERKIWDFELFFSDLTMLESEGEYNLTKKIMESEKKVITITSGGKSKEIEIEIGPSEWVIKTTLTISSQFGKCNLVLDFYYDGRVYIISYIPSVSGDFAYNPDMRCLSMWCQSNGWKVPQPSESLIKASITFWKKTWKTNIIDSDYLSQRYGERNTIVVKETEDDKE